MITTEKILQHKKSYPDFDDVRFVKWLDKKPGRWKSFGTVTAANKSRRRQTKFERYLESVD